MTITYKYPFSDRSTRVPILHKVKYGLEYDIERKIRVLFGLAMTHDQEVLDWCRDNCKCAWYASPSHIARAFNEFYDEDDMLFIEFEDDEDAIMFALRWT